VSGERKLQPDCRWIVDRPDRLASGPIFGAGMLDTAAEEKPAQNLADHHLPCF